MRMLLRAIAMMLAPMTAFAQSHSTSLADDTFIRAALASGTAEITNGSLYADSQDPRVLLFANTMVKDHTTANTALLALAKSLHVTVPNGVQPAPLLEQESPQPQSMSPQQRAARMHKPASYFAEEIKAHKTAIALFQRELSDGSNASVKAFAKETLPVLKAHLALARRDLAAERGRSR